VGGGKAFQVGILVTLITCTVYVVSWEIVYYNFVPDFVDRYAAHQIQKLQAKGATAPAIEAAKRDMARFKSSTRTRSSTSA
jgi:hypothetical protein